MSKILYSYMDSKVLEFVIMNEDLCFHDADFHLGREIAAFAKPIWIWKPKTDKQELIVEVRCPICDKLYEEASDRLKREIIERTLRLTGKDEVTT